jgi:hypothetical protein
MNSTPAHRAVQDPLGLRCGLPDVLGDQVVAHGVDQMALFQVAEPVQKFRHPQGHGGLPGPGRSGEAHVQVGAGRGQAELVPGPVDQEQGRDLLYFPLGRHQPDQVPVEGLEDVLDVARAPLGREGDGSVGRAPTFARAASLSLRTDEALTSTVLELLACSHGTSCAGNAVRPSGSARHHRRS